MSELHKQLGELLKAERERQEILIGDIAEKLKIAEANLTAIEAGDISSLPSEIYFSLFSKTYAEALGIDYQSVMDELKGRVSQTEDLSKKANNKKKAEASAGDEEPEKPKQSNFVKTAGFAFGGIVLVFVLFLLFNKFFLSSGEPMAANGNDGVHTEAVQQKSDSEMETLYADYDWESVVYEKPEKLTLTLVSTEQCWSAIFADGDTALYQNLRPNRLYTIEADYRILVSVGMPSKVTIKLNGQEVDLRNTESRRIYKVLINQLNYKEYLNPKPEEASTPPAPVNTLTDTPKPADNTADTLPQQELSNNAAEQSETEF